MQKSVSDLLDLCFELEGLLMLAERRDSSTPARVVELINQRINQLSEMSGEVFFAAPGSEAQQTAENEEIAAAAEFEEANDADEGGDENEVVAEPQPEAESPATEPEPEPAPEPEPEPVVVPEPVAEIKLQPIATSAPAEPIKPAQLKLTLNDKFRLKSAVFGGSEADMNEALQQIASLSDIDEVTEYIVNDLCLDLEDPDVAYFIELVETSRK